MKTFFSFHLLSITNCIKRNTFFISGVIEVRITPEPNLRGPRFLKFLYEAQISEAANKFATLISTEAIDPEGDLVRYAIVGGNEAGHFLIEESTGEIRVATSLDRETQERYSLVSFIRICY